MQGLLIGCYRRRGLLMSCYRKAWGIDLLHHKEAWGIATRFCPRGTWYMLMLSNADYSKMDAQQFVLCRCILDGCLSTSYAFVRLCFKYKFQILVS